MCHSSQRRAQSVRRSVLRVSKHGVLWATNHRQLVYTLQDASSGQEFVFLDDKAGADTVEEEGQPAILCGC